MHRDYGSRSLPFSKGSEIAVVTLQFEITPANVLVSETDLPLTQRELATLRISRQQLSRLFAEAHEITADKEGDWLFPLAERPRGGWWLVARGTARVLALTSRAGDRQVWPTLH